MPSARPPVRTPPTACVRSAIKKERKGHKTDCELLSTCPFFNDKAGDTFEMADIHKEQYCRGEYPWCGRYMVFKALERERGSLRPIPTTNIKIQGNMEAVNG